jgi:hypothetical protein
VVRTVLFGVWTGMEPNRPDGTCLHPDGAATTRQTVSKTVWTRATCLFVPNAARVQTTLMHRPDGDPTEALYTPDCRILSHTPHNLLFGIL